MEEIQFANTQAISITANIDNKIKVKIIYQSQNSTPILKFLRHLFPPPKAIKAGNSVRDWRTNLEVNCKTGPGRPIKETSPPKLPKIQIKLP